MATVTQSFPKILKMLRENSNTKEKREALTYIRSNAKKLESSGTIKEEQYKDLCKLVIDASTSKDHNVQHEAYDTLNCIVQDFRSHKLNLFESMLQINRKDRLKILKLLDVVDDVSISIAAYDTSILNLLNDCMHTVQPVIMDWFLPNACTDNLQKLTEIENKVLSDDQKLEEEMVNYSLNLLRRLYKVASTTADNKIQRFHKLLMDKVILLAYMGHKRQRSPALKVLQQAIMTNFVVYVRTELRDIWMQYKTALQSVYCKRMQLLVTACDCDWAVQWNISVQLLGTDLHRGANIINNLLSVEERAFKSADAIIRRQAFLSWKLLIDNFALDHQELATVRRIKLLCIPLSAKNSKTELIALTKLEVWWHLIIKLYKDIVKFVDPVITQFLNFCFGPLGDTPLLSSKCDVAASPGKKFFKTKLVAVDALCQLLVGKQENHSVHPSILEETLPQCICGAVFQECYKSIIHSVGEALLILSQLNDKEMKKRCQIGKLLWSSLVNYAQESMEEIKDSVYKDILLVINELANYIADKPMIKNLMLDVITFELPNFNKDIQIHSQMLSDLLFKLLSPPILPEIKTNHCKGLECLFWECVKPKVKNEYRSDLLEYLKTILETIVQVDIENKSVTVIPEIWCIVAKILTRYIEDSGNINEGNAAHHNFKNTEYILKYPFMQIILEDSSQIQEISGIWKKLYKEFDLQADLIATVKANEVLLNTVKMIQCCLNKNKDCTCLAVTCLDALLSSINYNSLLAHSEIPSIVEFLIDLTKITFNNSQFTDCDITLRALSAVLITVYGHNAKKAVLYLQYLKPVIELVLLSSTGTLLKEIASMWETVISIFKGLGKNYSSEILSLYKELITQAINHSNIEIAAQTLAFLDEASNFDDKAQYILEDIHTKIKLDKLPFKLNNVEKKLESMEKSTKQVKMTGSFLNRKSAIPKVVLNSAQKEKDGKRISIPDPESQEYVYIKPDIKYDVNRLTEHQKEVLKKKRDDIPALYNDLSQSSSQSSQHLQEWFDKRVKHISEVDYSHNSKKNDSAKEETIDHDDNKENTIDSTVTEYSITDKTDSVSTDLKLVQQSIPPVHSTSLLSEDSKSNRCSNVNATDNTSKEESSSISKIPTTDALGTSFEDGNEEIFDPIESDSVVKRLNFESREEFPNEKDLEQPLSPSVLDSTKRRNRGNAIKTNSNDVNSDKVTNNQAEQNGSKMARTLRPKSSLCKTSINNNTKDVGVINTKDKFLGEKKKGTKRKYASDSDCEENTHHRRRKKLTDSSETSSDTDCVQSVGRERSNSNTEEQGLSQRTKNEISRLKINMVFNSPLPNRRRSKPTDEMKDFNTKQLSENKGSRNKNTSMKNSEMKKTSKIESQEELKLNIDQVTLKKKKRKSGTIEQTDSDESHTTNAIEEAAEKESNKFQMKDSEANENMNERSDTTDMIIADDNNTDGQIKTTDMDTSPNAGKLKDDKKKLKEDDSNTNEMDTTDRANNEEQQTPMDDENEEIIQNSQVNIISKQEGKYNDKQCFIKIDKIDKIILSPIVLLNDASTKDISPGSTAEKKSTKDVANVPTKIPAGDSKNDDIIEDKVDDKIDDIIDDKIDDKTDDKIDDNIDDKIESNTEDKSEDKIEDKIDETMRIEDNTITTVNSEDEKKMSDTTQVNASPTRKVLSIAISSPKNNIKRFTKIKTYAPQGGRAAHMLGLVTKQALTEINSSSAKTDDDSIMKRFKTKDGENEVQVGKKDKTSIFKDNEKIAGPCSSRQEKIFNNMKSGEYHLSSPVKSFPNLKNDGEKISPNVDKAIPDYMLISLDNTFEKGSEGNLSPSHEKTELPMLEWSSANPPSLTASPSASILKRHRLSMPECEVEATTPNKRKRVSFADPPVSKQMGYEITLADSPHKTTKLSSRALMFRKDSPSRLKQTKLKFIQVDTEKMDKNIETLDHGCEIDLQCERENALLTKMAEELEFSENMVIDVDNHTTCGFSDNANDISETNKNLCTAVTINNLSQEIEISGGDTANLKESKLSSVISDNNKSQSEESETQQDIFSSVEYKSDIDQSVNSDQDAIDQNDSMDSSSLNVSNMDTEMLEDTVDVANVTGLNSTTNSDEIFCGKPMRTSTQTAENIADQDTLPVTDSIFGSLPLSQASESTGEIPQPELLDDKKPLCADLITCPDLIDSIIGRLTNPLWVQSLSNYFSSRNIRTIGDLAQLTEREINRIPVRGNPKVDFVRNVLKRRNISNLSETKPNDDTKTIVIPSTYDYLVPTENHDQTDCDPSLIPDTDDTTEATADVESIKKLDVSCQTEELLNKQNASTMTSDSLEVPVSTIYTDSVIYLDMPNDTTRETNSIGVSTDPTSPVRCRKTRKLTKSVGAQISLDDLLDEIDVKLVMQNAVKRSSSESILTQYKLKTRNLPESDLEKEALKVFGPENKSSYYEAKLKSSCRACGVNKVLLRLPDIFSGDKQFFNKVLSAYRKKITMSDCMSVFNFKEVKDFMCQKCTSSELAEILAMSLKEEEKRGIKSPMRELSCFSALLKRVPKDVVISHTVANEELIQPQLVLDIAMQNSSSADITRTLELQSPSITKDVFDKLWSSELVLSHIETKSERTELLKIYKAISTKLSPKELLEVYHESMMAKLPSEEEGNEAE